MSTTERTATAAELIQASGLRTVGADSPPDAVEGALRKLAADLEGADTIRREAVRAVAVKLLRPCGWRAAAIDAVLAPAVTATAADAVDVEPAADPVEGAQLLDDLADWLRRYIWMTDEARDALAAWAALTWFRDVVYFAPVLALLSATKRCGKTALQDLLRWTVHRGHQTSGIGATAAVLFRMNEQRKPTFLIDEAEKLSGVQADRDIIGLLNAGYRRGARVQRCSPDTHEIQEFDAFGFRALAAIGTLWDTLLDRAVVVRLERRPKDAHVERFRARVIETEGRALAARMARWTTDVAGELASAEEGASRPGWLNDRACDNWAGLFAVASVAGGHWPARIEAAARVLAREDADDTDGDRGERLLRDVHATFADKRLHFIQSGELVKALNDIDSAPWADSRRGAGTTTHAVARMLRPFGIRPRHAADKSQRGYHREDFRAAWERYEVSELSNINTDNDLDVSQTVRRRTVSESPNLLANIELASTDSLESPTLDDGDYDRLEREAIQAESANADGSP